MDLGFGDDRPIARYVAQEVTALKGAKAIAVVGNGYAVTADGRVFPGVRTGTGCSATRRCPS